MRISLGLRHAALPWCPAAAPSSSSHPSPPKYFHRQADARFSAPEPSLRTQYNQDGDPHRYEFMLRQSAGGGSLTRAGRRRQLPDSAPPSLAGGAVDAVVSLLSGRTLSRSESFCIVSEPGALDQPLHTDSVPVEGQMDADVWQTTLHYIGVLTPLCDTGPVCGQTGVVVGSHLNPLLGDAEVFGGGADGLLKHEVLLSLRRGDALFLDGRTIHRCVQLTCCCAFVFCA
jgi:hypothetical protein